MQQSPSNTISSTVAMARGNRQVWRRELGVGFKGTWALLLVSREIQEASGDDGQIS